MLLSVNRHNFEIEVRESSKLVFVNFWVNWSEQCKSMKLLMKKLDNQLDGYFKIVEIDWERESQLADHYNVVGTPTLLLFNGGKVVGRYSGTFDITELMKDAQSKYRHYFDVPLSIND